MKTREKLKSCPDRFASPLNLQSKRKTSAKFMQIKDYKSKDTGQVTKKRDLFYKPKIELAIIKEIKS
jgi:hypothetical protein